MRFVLDLQRTAEGVHGVVIREGQERGVTFSGWLELLRLLEADEGED